MAASRGASPASVLSTPPSGGTSDRSRDAVPAAEKRERHDRAVTQSIRDGLHCPCGLQDWRSEAVPRGSALGSLDRGELWPHVGRAGRTVQIAAVRRCRYVAHHAVSLRRIRARRRGLHADAWRCVDSAAAEDVRGAALPDRAAASGSFPRTSCSTPLWPGEHVNDSAVTLDGEPRARRARSGPRPQAADRDDSRARLSLHVAGRSARRLAAPPPPRGRGVPGARARRVDTPAVRRAARAVMRRLEALLRDASAGHGRLCLLHGEAGIGKTRCAQELMQAALSSGHLDASSGRAAQAPARRCSGRSFRSCARWCARDPSCSEVGNEVLSRLVALRPRAARARACRRSARCSGSLLAARVGDALRCCRRRRARRRCC